jgi:N-acetylmuramoyl-L-alanine amidase
VEEAFVSQASKGPTTMFLPRSALLSLIGALLYFIPVCRAETGIAARVDAIRFWSFGDVTRIAIETQGDYHFTSDSVDNPSRIFFDLNGLRPPSTVHHGMQTIAVGDRRIKQIRLAEVIPGTTRIVLDLTGPSEVLSSQLVNPDRLIIEIRPRSSVPLTAQNIPHSVTGAQRVNLTVPAMDVDKDLPPPVFRPVVATMEKPVLKVPETPAPALTVLTADLGNVRRPKSSLDIPATSTIPPATTDEGTDPSYVRVLGLKLGRVVIDAGHGGKDTGTIGRNGLLEKDLVLDVALRLGKLIRQQLAADVVYTRSDDTFIPLGERTAIANRAKADLFISIHANASADASATGVETYYFNLHGDKKALDVAMRENAAADSAISDLNDLLKKAVLQTKLEESREFAQKVQEPLTVNAIKMNGNAHERGVRKAPFVVLIGASMPSILAEIGFVSNPHDEKLLRRSDQREKIAQALFKGVMEYANSLNHPQMARAGSE